MRLNSDLTKMFDSPAKIKVLRYIIKPGFMMTGREVARIGKIAASMALKILKEFEDMNLVTGRRAGKSVVWSAREDSYAYSVAVKLFGAFSLFSPVAYIKSILKEWAMARKKYVESVVLFGSVASGEENTSSDIDLYVRVKTAADKQAAEKSLEDLSVLCIKLFGNVLNPYILTKNEWQVKKDSGLMENIDKGVKIL